MLVADDFARGRSEIAHLIRDSRSGRTFTLRFDRAPRRRLTTGAMVAVSGRRHGSELLVRAAALDASASAEPETQPITAQAAPVGNQRTLVMLAQFTDATVSCDASYIRDLMFTDPGGSTVDALYRESSGGRVSLSGEVVGPFQLPFASTDTCDIGAWADAADAAAAAAGETPASYTRKVYVMPPSSCWAAGYGTLGGSPSGASIFSCDLKGVYSHELGHNLGMDHASTPTSGYGDSTDPMAYGSTRLRGVNAPHRQQLGWIEPAGRQFVTQSGVYNLAPLATDPAIAVAPRTLAIAKPDTGETYYVSYRVGQGFDNNIDGGYLDKLSVHRFKDDGSASKSVLLAGLGDGQQFVDAINGITVTAVGHGPFSATVQVTLAAPCTATPPVLVLSPHMQSGAGGTTRSYAVTVTNMDTGACAASSLSMAVGVPAGWAGAVSPSLVSLAPGATASGTMTVTPSMSATPGSYLATLSLGDAAAPAHASSIAASYTVTATCIAAAPVLTVSPASQTAVAGTALTYALTVTNRDSASCASSTFNTDASIPGGWTRTMAPASFTLAPGQVATVFGTVSSSAGAPAGTYGLALSARDVLQASHGASLPASYSVQAPGDHTAPSAPANLTASVMSKQKQVQLSWLPATDNVGVTGYRVLRDGMVAATVTSPGWVDTLYVAGASRIYAVVALDAAGNISPSTNVVTVTLSGSAGKKR